MIGLGIEGLQEVQAAVNQTAAAVKPSGAFGRAIKDTTTHAHRYAVSITHVDTGALRASHLMKVSGTHGLIYLNPSASNPRSGQRTAVYGPYEERRGGSHAFYARTVREVGDRAMRSGMKAVMRALP